MESTEPSAIHLAPPGRSRWALALWLAGALVMAAAPGFGVLSEGLLQGSALGAGDPARPLVERVLPFLFAFGFPLGLGLCALASRLPLALSGAARYGPAAAVVLLTAAPVLVPVIAGRAMVPGFFGVGGTLIAAAAVLVFFLLGQVRRTVPGDWAPPLDLLLWGLACFAAAAWNLCGLVAMPSHLLVPETVMWLGTLAFAIGQAKTVMVLLAVGWVLVLLAAAAARTRVRRHGSTP